MATRKKTGSFRLESRSVGALPVVNHFLDRIGMNELLERYIPAGDRRCRLAPSRGIGLLLRNILLGRAPVYALEQWAAPFDPALLGVDSSQIPLLNDDRVGRSLDRLFKADRASLLTEVVVRAVREFEVDLTQIHNDSTTITFSGEYAGARGEPRKGRPTLLITHGFNKDHRPDLKQLLWILTVSADGAVPVHFRACNGNTTDDQTHIDTWNTIRRIVKRTDFLYVADSKLCTRSAMEHIAGQGGRFLTVLPRTRREETWFRDWVQTHNPQWIEVRRRRNPRREDGPPDIYRVAESPIRSVEGYRIVWVWSSLKADQDQRSRQARIEKGILALEVLETRLRGKRSRFKDVDSVSQAAQAALQATGAQRWLVFTIHEITEESFRQEKQGRPGSTTRYLRRQRRRFRIEWRPAPETIDYDAHTDGMFPLLTNDMGLSAADVLEKYKYQPQLEKRHEQLKTVRAVTPVLLKSVTRIEALLMVYFLALLMDALIEREMRRAMKAARIPSLPLYPEERACRAPTTDRLLEILGDLSKHTLLLDDAVTQTFPPELSDLQRDILRLLGVPLSAYASKS